MNQSGCGALSSRMPAVPFFSAAIAPSTSACEADAPAHRSSSPCCSGVLRSVPSRAANRQRLRAAGEHQRRSHDASKARITPALLMTPPWNVPCPNASERTRISKKMRRFYRRATSSGGSRIRTCVGRAMRLQRISFGHSDIPPSWSGGDCRGRELAAGSGRPGLDLELGVLRPAEDDSSPALDCVSRNEPPPPIADDNEQTIAARASKPLHETAPALIAAASAHRDAPAPLMERDRSSPERAASGRRAQR